LTLLQESTVNILAERKLLSGKFAALFRMRSMPNHAVPVNCEHSVGLIFVISPLHAETIVITGQLRRPKEAG